MDLAFVTNANLSIMLAVVLCAVSVSPVVRMVLAARAGTALAGLGYAISGWLLVGNPLDEDRGYASAAQLLTNAGITVLVVAWVVRQHRRPDDDSEFA